MREAVVVPSTHTYNLTLIQHIISPAFVLPATYILLIKLSPR